MKAQVMHTSSLSSLHNLLLKDTTKHTNIRCCLVASMNAIRDMSKRILSDVDFIVSEADRKLIEEEAGLIEDECEEAY